MRRQSVKDQNKTKQDETVLENRRLSLGSGKKSVTFIKSSSSRFNNTVGLGNTIKAKDDVILSTHNPKKHQSTSKNSIRFRQNLEGMKSRDGSSGLDELERAQIDAQQDNIVFLQGALSNATYTKLVGAKNIATIKESWMKTYTGNMEELTREIKEQEEETVSSTFGEKLARLLARLLTVSDIEAIIVLHVSLLIATFMSMNMTISLMRSSYCTKFGAFFYSLALGFCLLIVIYCAILTVIAKLIFVELNNVKQNEIRSSKKMKKLSKKDLFIMNSQEEDDIQSRSNNLLDEEAMKKNHSFLDRIKGQESDSSMSGDNSDQEISIQTTQSNQFQERLTKDIVMRLIPDETRQSSAVLRFDISTPDSSKRSCRVTKKSWRRNPASGLSQRSKKRRQDPDDNVMYLSEVPGDEDEEETVTATVHSPANPE